MTCDICGGVGRIIWVRERPGTSVPVRVDDPRAAGCNDDECPACFGAEEHE